jgi:L-lactate dehydrogenase
MRLQDYCAANGPALDAAARRAIYEQTRDAAYEIIKRKGATYYAIGAGLVRIVEAVLRDQRTVLTVSSVSSVLDGPYGLSDVALSLPTVIDRGGVEQVIRLRLSDEEEAGLLRSAGVLRGHLESLT